MYSLHKNPISIYEKAGMSLIEMWAGNNSRQSMEQATKKIADARAFVIDKMQAAGMEA